MKPWELSEAEMVLGLCERFHALPSQVLSEPVSALRYLMLAKLGEKEADG